MSWQREPFRESVCGLKLISESEQCYILIINFTMWGMKERFAGSTVLNRGRMTVYSVKGQPLVIPVDLTFNRKTLLTLHPADSSPNALTWWLDNQGCSIQAHLHPGHKTTVYYNLGLFFCYSLTRFIARVKSLRSQNVVQGKQTSRSARFKMNKVWCQK